MGLEAGEGSDNAEPDVRETRRIGEVGLQQCHATLLLMVAGCD